MLDQVRVIATGGTIASHLVDGEWVSLPGAQLVDELGALPSEVDVVDVAAGSSSNLSAGDMAMISRRVGDAVADGVAGVVVTHGTDTLELTSYLCSLMVDTEKSAVVFTGAMRPHSGHDIDGPQNLRDAIHLAGRQDTCLAGVVVALGGRIHLPAHVRKTNAVDVEAFTSYPFEPIGHIRGGVIAVNFEPEGCGHPPVVTRNIDTNVELVVCYPGMAAGVLEQSCARSRAVVLEVFGDLNSPENLWPVMRRASDDGVLVVTTSNSYTPTITNDGLASLGVRGMGGLTSQKSRLALMCALGDGRTRAEAEAYLDSLLGVS